MQQTGWSLLFLAVAFCASFAYLLNLDVGLFDQGNDSFPALAAKRFLDSGFFGSWNHPPFSFVVLVVFFKLFGATDVAARLSALVFFIFGGFLVFRLAARLHSPAAGALSAYLYLFSPFLMRGVFTYWRDVILMVFVLASVHCICGYLGTRRVSHLVWGGISAGMAILTKETALLLVPVYFVLLRKDRHLPLLLFIMSFFTAVWLVGYTLLNPLAYQSAVLLPVELLLGLRFPEAPAAPVSLLLFAKQMTFVVFALAAFGAFRLFSGRKKGIWMVLSVPAVMLVLFSVSEAKNIKYFFPAVPFLLMFASVALVELFSLVRGRRLLRYSFAILCSYLLASYAAAFLDGFEDRSRAWEGSPRIALVDFVDAKVGKDDAIALLDEGPSAWLEFYTGRRSYSVPVYYSDAARFSLVGGYSPRFLVVRGNPGVNVSVFSGDCGFFGFVGGRSYNYSVYSCVWS